MKKNIIIMFIMLVFIVCLTTIVYAEGSPITVNGDNTITPGGTKELSVNVSSSEEIGIISGIITATDNVSSYTATAQNGWNLTFNKNTGEFNIFKAEGAKAETIMKISYTVTENEGTATVSLTNLKATTIEYDEDEPADVVKAITVKTAEENLETEPKGETEKDDATNQESGQKDIQSNKQDNNSNGTQKTEDTSKANKNINYAGKENYIIAIVVVAILGAIAFVKYKQYKNI